MTSDVDDAWETDQSSGLVGHFVGRTSASHFVSNAKFDKVNLEWETEFLDNLEEPGVVPEFITKNDGELPVPVRFGIGTADRWEVEEGGARIVRADGKPKVHASSEYGRLIDAVLGKLDGWGDSAEASDGTELTVDLTTVAETIRARGNPLQSDIWEGLVWEYREVVFDYGEITDKDGKKRSGKTRPKAMPVRFLGVGDDYAQPEGVTEATGKVAKEAKSEAKEAKPAAKPAAAAKTPEPEPTPEPETPEPGTPEPAASANGDRAVQLLDGIGADVSPEMRAEVLEALHAADTYEDFVATVLSIPDAAGVDSLVTLIGNEDAGLWAAKT